MPNTPPKFSRKIKGQTFFFKLKQYDFPSVSQKPAFTTLQTTHFLSLVFQYEDSKHKK